MINFKKGIDILAEANYNNSRLAKANWKNETRVNNE